ncbi:MAG: hypothetical protein M3347_01135, partial [Armatimonadota bacterium]|nr:hypothetical protein [Armatimonadota bacterium]
TRHVMNPDGIAYLDMGDAYWRGDWNTAINALWSPLYSWVLGGALLVLQPSREWEFPVVHLVNFALYLAALCCFEFLLREFMACQRRATERLVDRRIALPEWAFMALGYSVFIWSSLSLITLGIVSPDMLVAALVYVASALLLRIQAGRSEWSTFILLGLVLSFGYLAKAPMFPLAFIFLGASLFAAGDLRRAAPRVLVASIVFLAVAGPFVLALSKSKGRLTFGDSARLNYAWCVSGATLYVHWQGEPPGSGTPVHTTRRISTVPAIYEFGTPIGGTYPLWYDPSYWYEGVVASFNWKGQMNALRATAGVWWYILFHLQRGLIVLLFILLYMSRRSWSGWKNMAQYWVLLVPAMVACGMFSLVNLEPRYVGAFVVLLCLGALAGVRLPNSRQGRSLLNYATATMLLLLALGTGSAMAQGAKEGKTAAAHAPWQVAAALDGMGVRAGDKVASIGDSFRAYWARLARVRIVAEIPSKGPYNEIAAGDVDSFWMANEPVKTQAVQAFARTGAKAIVTDEVPASIAPGGWQKIGNTKYYVYALSRSYVVKRK